VLLVWELDWAEHLISYSETYVNWLE